MIIWVFHKHPKVTMPQINPFSSSSRHPKLFLFSSYVNSISFLQAIWGLNVNTCWFFPFIPSIQSADESHYLWNRISRIFLLCYHGSTWQESFLYACLWFVNKFPNEPLDICLVAHLFLWTPKSVFERLLLVMSCSCLPTSGSLGQWKDFKILSPT